MVFAVVVVGSFGPFESGEGGEVSNASIHVILALTSLLFHLKRTCCVVISGGLRFFVEHVTFSEQLVAKLHRCHIAAAVLGEINTTTGRLNFQLAVLFHLFQRAAHSISGQV